jgi:dTDP-4-amino-4,6-dideoxygalactose transaminase
MAGAADLPFVDLRAQYLRLKDDIDARIARVLDHGHYMLGPEVAELEAELARFAGCRHAVAVASGTDALLMPLMAEKAGPGDAVFVPAFTFAATAEVAVLRGAAPVFVDIDPATFLIDIEDLERKIRDTRAGGRLRPRAVIAVDLFGLAADYDALRRVATDHGLILVADAAQSFGASRGGRRVGSLAPVTATSFYPSKPLGCYGDGGAILTDDPALADAVRELRNHGQRARPPGFARIGLNSRLDTIQAAVLLAKLRVFDDEIAARNRLAAFYDRAFAGLAAKGLVVTAPRVAGTMSVWAQYGIQCRNRDRVVEGLRALGIPTAVHYRRPVHLQPAYEAFGDGPGSLPATEHVSARILCLPMHPYMDETTARRIADGVIAAVEQGEAAA